MTIAITPTITLDERELDERFVRASGPGGQNVNKVATAVELRFDVAASSLPPDVKTRLAAIAGSRMSSSGVLLIDSRAFRTQALNREAARERLIAMIQQAAIRPEAPNRHPARASRQGAAAHREEAASRSEERPRPPPRRRRLTPRAVQAGTGGCRRKQGPRRMRHWMARRDGRVVDGGGLENRCTGNRIGGSNPSPSAILAGSDGLEGDGFRGRATTLVVATRHEST